jgi:hypothetical protein
LVILAGGGLGLALAAVLASGGAGGLVGALVAAGFHHHAKLVEGQLRSGGVTIWVGARTEPQTTKVGRIFDQHRAVHPVEAGRSGFGAEQT